MLPITVCAAEARERYDRAKGQAIQSRTVGGFGPGAAAHVDIVSGAAWTCADRYPNFCSHYNAIAHPYANTAATYAVYVAHRVAG
jgi:hypothetical protein